MAYNQACLYLNCCLGVGTDTMDSYSGYAILQVGGGTDTRGIIQTYDGQVKSALVSNCSGYGIVGTRSNHNLHIFTNDTVRMFICNTGNVGIGTTSPNSRFHINQTGQPDISCGLYATQILQTDSQENYQRIRFDRDSCPFWGIGVEGASSTNDLIISGLIGGKISGTWSDNVFKIKNSNGFVGIGVTSPQSKLHVEGGQIRLHGLPSDDITACSGYYIGNAPNNEAFQWQMSCNFNLSLWTYSASGGFGWGLRGPVITQTGNVGIGTTTPGDKLTIGGGGIISVFRSTNDRKGCLFTDSEGTKLSSDSAGNDPLYLLSPGASGQIRMCVGGNATMTVGASNVGIGTTSPSQLLHVVNTSVDAEKGIIVANNNTGTSAHASLRIDGYAGSYIDFYRNTGFRWRFQRIAFSDDFKITADTGNGGAGDVMYFDYDTGRVGMRVTSPNHTLSLDGNVGVVGYNWKLQSDGDGNWGFGLCNCGSTYYTYLTYGSDIASDRRGGIFDVSSNFWVAYGNCVRNFIVGNCVGIGTTTPSYRLHVNGTFYAAGSSIKYKEGICNYDTNSCLFMCLKPVAYQYKDEWKHLGKELKSDIQIGLIAEDVADVMPELAVLVNEEDEKVVRNVDYEKLSIVLLAEVQKLRREVDTLKNN